MAKQDVQGKAMQWMMKLYSSSFFEKHNLRSKFDRFTYTTTKLGAKAAARAATKNVGEKKQVNKRNMFNLHLSEEQGMICDAIHKFSEEQLRPAAYLADKEAQIPEEIFHTSLELGLAYLAVPEDLGGAATEYEPISSVLIAEKLAWGDLSMAYALLSSLAFANAIQKWGSEQQKQSHLGLFTQDMPPKACIALQEKSVFFDPHQLTTVAKKTRRGFTLQGEKVFVPLGNEAEFYLVAAQYKQQPRIFIVPAKSNGVQWRETPSMGLKAAQVGLLKLDNVKLDNAALLGEKNASFDYQAFLDFGRLHTAAMAVGTCQAVLDYVIPYVNEREAFGEPISHRQSVAFMVADIALELEGMRLALWRAASLAQQNKPFTREAALAHYLCKEKGMQIGTQGVQLLGGHGFTKEHPVERWYRDLRSIALLHSLHA